MSDYQQAIDLLAFIQRHPGHASQKPHGRRYGASGEALPAGHKQKDVVTGGSKAAQGRQKSSSQAKPKAKTTKKTDGKHGFLSADMKKTEESFAPLANERAAVFDKSGKKLFETSNDNVNEVTFSTEQLQQMRGAVVTHNHPDYKGQFSDGGSFSMSDVQLMVNTGASEVRAVTNNYIYRIRPKIISGTNVTQGALGFAEQTSKKLKTSLSEQVKSGKISSNEAQVQHWHSLWSAVAEQGFIEYERVPR